MSDATAKMPQLTWTAPASQQMAPTTNDGMTILRDSRAKRSERVLPLKSRHHFIQAIVGVPKAALELDNPRSVPNRCFRVEVTFLTAEEGGRTTPVGPKGYRPLFRLEGSEQLFGLCELDFEDGQWVPPGGTSVGLLTLRLPPEILPDLARGQRLNLFEGAHIVGRGTVGERVCHRA
jgi:hypothetical protein